MRGPNNVLFTAVQALFDEILFPKCPDMCHPGYTPVMPPVDAQGEYNIPPVDNENGDHGGTDMNPAPPGRCVPYQAPPPGNNQNPDPLTLPGSTPPDSDSDDGFHRPCVPPATPPPRSPHGDPDLPMDFLILTQILLNDFMMERSLSMGIQVTYQPLLGFNGTIQEEGRNKSLTGRIHLLSITLTGKANILDQDK